MNKKYSILYTFLLPLIFCSVNLKGQNSSIDSLSAEETLGYGDTNTICLSVRFEVVNIDSLDELNFELVKHTGDTIFITGEIVEKLQGGYKVLINNTLQFIGYQKGSFQRINIYLPKSEKGKISEMFFNAPKKGSKKNMVNLPK